MKSYKVVLRAKDKAIFEEIIEGKKIIETRAATVKYRTIQIGDNLIFNCGSRSVKKQIMKIEHFNTIDEMFMKLPLKSIFPSLNNINEAKKIYFSFTGYKEKIESVGILAFSIG